MTEKRLSVDCVILGGGGHAKGVIETLGLTDPTLSLAMLDRDDALQGHDILGVPVLGNDEMLDALVSDGVTRFVVGCGGVGDTSTRKRLFELGISKGLEPLGVFHPTAIISRSAHIGEGAHLLAGCKIGASVQVGQNVIVNTGAVVEHDCRIGDHVHIATGAILSGTVSVGSETHVGAGAVVRQSLSLGKRCIVGVGAAVVEGIEDDVVVAGVPARPLT